MNPEPHLATNPELPPTPPTPPTIVGYQDDSFPPGLTPRETVILRYLVDGLKPSEISDRLRISNRNVEKYISRLHIKLDAFDHNSPLNALFRNG